MTNYDCPTCGQRMIGYSATLNKPGCRAEPCGHAVVAIHENTNPPKLRFEAMLEPDRSRAATDGFAAGGGAGPPGLDQAECILDHVHGYDCQPAPSCPRCGQPMYKISTPMHPSGIRWVWRHDC